MLPSFSIQGRPVGPAHEPLVIAEIGINHEGSLDAAIAMVDAAQRAGAEVIKHQTHIVEDEMSVEARDVVPGNAEVSIFDIMARCALSEADETALMKYAQAKGLIFISTPFSRAAAYRLQRMGVPAYKIGSGECSNYPLLRLVASFGKPIILSTGMNDLASVGKSVQILRAANVPFALLHCTNVYPTPYHLVRLGALQRLAEAFPDAVVGLSDHTVDNYACLAAVALGASIVERHFTDDMCRPGPDIACSMDPAALAQLIRGSQAIFLARGGEKQPLPEEAATIKFAFASVVADRDIRAGELLTEENLWVKRPGTGAFSAEDYDRLLGRYAARDIKKGAQLRNGDVQA
ncbi:N-acetylneuraminate synthase family protein [Allopusillimonas ginsengisoli]|uniref:N-acetylneuraminate synthase family protein n=1 Tax=Allopusillimonas ginsengisoli TaxID=453575 RepID=UPI0010212E32|nr:N-acetylneuraminate synthase family protein [Allopusillimonas ginsengisoli]TEA78017.1 polyhydroxyalkanoate biosynthesis repressor PhaR [Allopusillimonas ginsengisoli]